MSTPNVSVSVEPSEAGSVYYLPLAGKTITTQGNAQLSLQLTILNQGTSAVHINKLNIAFTAPPSVSSVTIPLSLNIAPGVAVEWNFDTPNNILLPFPTPSQVKLSLYADNYTAPANSAFPLIPYHTSSAGGSYLFPTRASALEENEFWKGANGVHGSGYLGSQLFAYDLDVAIFDPAAKTWSSLHPGTNGDNNSDLRIWGKPVTAVADGYILEGITDVPNNPHPLHWTSDADLQQQLDQQQTLYWGSYKNGGAGNHFYIQHGDEVVLYAHMQKGSLDSSLVPPPGYDPHDPNQTPIPVKAGQFLGLAGNAGNSTGPHLHVHAIKGIAPESGPLRPMAFHNTLAVDENALTTPYKLAPWSTLSTQGLPSVWSAVYPALTILGKNTPQITEVAIDPLALVLRNDIYVLLTLPDPAPIEVLERQMAEQVRGMSPVERKQALSRAETFQTYATAIKRALER